MANLFTMRSPRQKGCPLNFEPAVGLERMVARLHRKRLEQASRWRHSGLVRRFRLAHEKEAAGGAVAVMLIGIMDIECYLVFG